MKKLLFLIIVLAFTVFGAVGPVSQYGQLQAGKNSAGKGRIYGSCLGVSDGNEVQVKGMSLYWSLLSNATEFYNSEAVTKMVQDMKIQIIRIPMATGSEDWGEYKGYGSDPSTQKNFVNSVVQAAIDNDIYVIIDWHSHCAEQQTQSAVGFFTEMSQKWGSYDNVIFEIYNEPKNSCGESYPDTNAAKQYWQSGIKPYAESVISAIRQHSDNLVIVGTPYYDQFTNAPITSPLTDNNVAYTFHYYAGSHTTSGEGAKALKAINAGLTVFVSEWGTGNADGGGDVSNKNDSWQTWLNNNKLSWANWSASKISEGTAAFNGGSTRYNFSYTSSGNAVKGYLSSNPSSYTACGSTPAPVVSSSSSTVIPVYSSSSYVQPPVSIVKTKNSEVLKVKTIFDMHGNKVNQINKPGIYLKLYTNGSVRVHKEI